MVNKIMRFCEQAFNHVYGFDRQTWLYVFAAVVVVGALCLRGFGSRTDY